MKNFIPKGVCAQNISFETQDNVLKKVEFTGGCNGNLQAISTLVEGLPVDEVIRKLKGIRCGMRSTSCADQLVKALEEHAEHSNS